ncbi:N-terminal EF-hand calcium-binding protein 1-like isoform X2 [Gigantopelta aegis]|uniref:N-terminal EF-hand calcium-binding protein 1-like isoform X2 n=1 Tax=Gigantopelta aegis TaxID=1735272 RepID=UPI001B8875FA|nr:N-terminal EF-hand calcium-binding protein 1-like isoform X2 [Gigantopelta aegis]
MATNAAEEKGTAIFLDVFRRADKSDSGFISWEEFVMHFADGVMGKEELKAIFDEIDTHNTNSIDTGELCSYFSKHLGEFRCIFASVEDLSAKITNALFATAPVYEKMNRTEKFVRRFLLRETINQLSALQLPVEAASDHLDYQAREERKDILPVEVDQFTKAPGSVIPGRIVRRAKRQVSSQSTGSESGVVGLNQQVDRLASLVDKLEHKVNFEGFTDEELVTEPDSLVLMVQRDFNVRDSHIDDFRKSLRSYVEAVQGIGGCLNVCVRNFQNTGRFSMYEIWESEEKQQKSADTDAVRSFNNDNKQNLQTDEVSSSISVPANWWKRDV